MTADVLNDRFADILDQMALLIDQFSELRDQVSDDAWDTATERKPWADTLTDIEYAIEQALEAHCS